MKPIPTTVRVLAGYDAAMGPCALRAAVMDHVMGHAITVTNLVVKIETGRRTSSWISTIPTLARNYKMLEHQLDSLTIFKNLPEKFISRHWNSFIQILIKTEWKLQKFTATLRCTWNLSLFVVKVYAEISLMNYTSSWIFINATCWDWD